MATSEVECASTSEIQPEYEDMLDFERAIFLDAVEKDCLFISAKGLHLDTVITNLLKVYCDPGNLIIVLNSSESEELYYIKKLNSAHVYSSNYQTAQNLREEVYLNGGIHFVTTRILVVDLLKRRVPIEKITGVVVLRAHSILESCQEAFALRLYRQSNKTGFIKAFSHCAQSFTIGFGQVERVMRTIFVKELCLWPRFHSTVIQDLKKYEPVVIELHVPIPSLMEDAQTTILDLMNQLVKELKRTNKTLELQEITVENCLTKKFHKILQAQLDTIWYQLNTRTKSIVADLKTLRSLMICLIHSDVVSFYALVNKYMTKEYALSTNWVSLEGTNQLCDLAKRMIFRGKPSEEELDPKPCPKWEALHEILKQDIPADLRKLKETYPNITNNVKVLILCNDSNTCYQLQQVLTHGSQKLLFFNVIKNKIPFSKISPNFTKEINLDESVTDKSLIEQKMSEILTLYESIPKKKTKTSQNEKDRTIRPDELSAIFENVDEDEIEADTRNSYLLTVTQLADATLLDSTLNNSTIKFESYPELENLDLTQIQSENPIISIQTFKDKSNSFSLKQSLMELAPNYIIMYHSDMAAIRQIEMYEAKNKRKNPLKVYFLIHAGTVEEQSYLTTLRREKQAFEFLIETKSKMVVPDYQDGKSEDAIMLQRELKTTSDTRKGGEEEVKCIPKIIVDMREFRSELPALIHRRGIEIEPVTISVGDYVLTPEVCVERKSLSDLIQSLNSGRLYHQCVQMSRYYTKPMLLIEFDQNKPFQLFQNNFDSANNAILQKLQLLTLHFPRLKLIWSPSPYATAQLFEELKEGKEQPSTEYAAGISGDDDLEVVERKYNSMIYDFVQKLPGVNSKNIDTFMRRGKNLSHIISLSEEELGKMLENQTDAQLLYSIIHGVHKPEEESSEKQDKPGTSKWKRENKFRNKNLLI